MAEVSVRLTVMNTVLLAAVLVTTATMTCSNDRLEDQVIKLRKAVESGGTSGGGGGPAPAAAATREPGKPSGVEAVGWGGRRAQVTFVEGAAADAALTPSQKRYPQGDWFVQRRNSAPKTLNYYTTSDGETDRISTLCLSRLMALDLDHPPNVEPALATSWDVAPDKVTYTYHLRRGVQFADGRPFTAADVRFTFDVIRDPAVDAAAVRSQFEDVESLDTPDPYTVVVKYKRKYWKGLYTVGFTLKVLNKGWYEAEIPEFAKKNGFDQFAVEPGKPHFGEVFNKMRLPCPGTGPYYIRSDDDFTKDLVVLVQNPFHFGMQVYPDRYNFAQFRWRFIADDVAASEAFRKQEFDTTTCDHDLWADQLKDDPTIAKVAKHFSYDHIALDCNVIVWNNRMPPFDDKRVRTAMTHLMDREFMLKEFERGEGTIAVCKSKRSFPSYSPELAPHPYDVEKAKKLLAEAGWRDSDGDGVLDKDGKRFEFDLKVPSGYPIYERIGGLLRNGCQKAGIRCTVAPLEWATFLEDLETHNFAASCLVNSWSDVWIDNYEAYHSSQDVPRGNNTPGFRNARADELLAAMREEFDEGKRNEMFHEFNRIYYDEQPETVLIHQTVGLLANKRFENLRIREATGLQFIDFWVKPENVLHK